MSSDLDLVRSIYADWERGDFRNVVWAHPEIVFAMVGGPDPGVWKGLHGMARYNRGWLEAWENSRIEADEFRTLDDGRLLVLIRASAHGKTSGLDLAQAHPTGAQLFRLEGGKVISLVT